MHSGTQVDNSHYNHTTVCIQDAYYTALHFAGSYKRSLLAITTIPSLATNMRTNPHQAGVE